MILPLGFIVDEVLRNLGMLCLLFGILVLIEDSGASMSAYVLFVKM